MREKREKNEAMSGGIMSAGGEGGWELEGRQWLFQYRGGKFALD